MKNKNKSLMPILAMMLAACGGGGGGDGGGTVVNPGAPTVAAAAITAANAPDIAGAVVVASDSTSESAATAPVGSGGSQPTALPAKGSAQLAAVSVGPESEPCSFGGMLTAWATVENPNLAVQGIVQAGDRFRSDFSQCDEGAGVFNGGFDFTVRAFSGNVFDLYRLDMNATLRNFSYLNAGRETILDGRALLLLDIFASPVTFARLESDRLDVELIENGNSFTATFFDFSEEGTVDLSTDACNLSASGAIQSSLFDGEAEFVTTANLVGSCSGRPDSGALLITGADDASIRVTVLDNVNVQLEVDLDGDGSVDETLVRTWDELDPL